jgi:phosphate transport system substrate-binding protein
MLKTLLTLALLSAPAAAAVTLNGAGATFPYPIYSKWFDEYAKVKAGVQINYQSIGSGGGIRQITAHTVDFGASDGPMTDKQLFSVDGKILHVPTVLGAVVPAFNLKDVKELTLTGEVLAKIFMGDIKAWNDPAIKALNPSANLPDMPITVIHRSDGSGTTYCFTDYLSKVSKDWAKKVGKNTSVEWPIGLGGKGNEGVAGLIKVTPNSLGYVEMVYAEQSSLSFASMVNAAGKTVKASVEGITAAAAGVKVPKDFRVSITNAPGEKAYPIATYTWLLIYQKNGGDKGTILREFLKWMLIDGQKLAPALGYAPLPGEVNQAVSKAIETIK